jgi:hypothetical protein
MKHSSMTVRQYDRAVDSRGIRDRYMYVSKKDSKR